MIRLCEIGNDLIQADLKYRKMPINVLINKIYLYDDKIIIFNTQDKPVDIEISLVEDIKSLFKGKDALPIRYLI